MEHKCLNIFVLALLFFIDSVYNRPKSLKHHQQDDIFDMVKADRVVEAANEDFMNIEGMEKRAGGVDNINRYSYLFQYMYIW